MAQWTKVLLYITDDLSSISRACYIYINCRFLALIMVPGLGFILWLGLKSNQNVVGYSHGIHTSIVPVGMSGHTSQQDSPKFTAR